jgi:SAM-dependent methyltransferase
VVRPADDLHLKIQTAATWLFVSPRILEIMFMAEFATTYEAVQSYSWLTRFLHKGRYQKLLKVLEELKREVGGRRIKMLDIGCGPGTVVEHVVNRFDVDYLGVDHDPTFIDAANRRYEKLGGCRFMVGDATTDELYHSNDADIVTALETLEHIPLNRAARLVEYVCHIVRPRFFLVTLPVEVGPAVWIKNWGSTLMGYDRKSGNFRETLWAGLYQLDRVPPHYASHQGFDWRCVAQLIRVNAHLREVQSLPFSFVPRSLSPNVALLAEPRKWKVPPGNADHEAWRINHQPSAGAFGQDQSGSR